MSLESFMPAIIADRDSDVPRLIAADWLEENGRPKRAEFIRVQCELAKIDREKKGSSFFHHEGSWSDLEFAAEREANPQLERLQRREQELFYKYGMKWFGWIPSTQDTRSWGVDYLGPRINSYDDWIYRVRRGFVNQVAITWEGWLKHAATILEMTPLETVELMTFPDVHTWYVERDRYWKFQFEGMPSWKREWQFDDFAIHMHDGLPEVIAQKIIQDKVLPSMWSGLTFILPRGNS